MDAKPRWRTWAEPLRRAAAGAAGRNGHGTRPRFIHVNRTSLNSAATAAQLPAGDSHQSNGEGGASHDPSELQSAHSTLLDCCIAIGGVALALLVRKLLDPLIGQAQPFVTFYIAIAAAAWFGGLLPGLLSLVLSAIAGWYFFIHTRTIGASLGAFAEFTHVFLFALAGGTMLALVEAYRAMRTRAENADEASQLYQDEIARGVADRNAIERALRAAEHRLQRVIDTNIAGVITCDDQGTITHANDAFLRMLGYSRDEFAQRRPTWRDLTPPEYTEADEASLAELARSGSCAAYEKAFLHHDGKTHVPVLMAGLRFDPPAPGGIGFVVDLTPLNKARQALQLQSRVLETMSEGVVVDDLSGNIAFTNPALDHMFGYEAGELVGQRVQVLHTLAGADWQDLIEEIKLALRIRGQWTGELDHRRKDGSTFLASAHLRAMSNPDGREYWVCVIEDVTQRRATQRAIHEAEDRLSMAMAAASMGAWELDPRTDQLTASANVRALLSDTNDANDESQPAVVSMEDFYATLHEDDRDRIRQAVHDALEGTHDYDVEFRGMTRAGELRWLAARAKVFRDEFGHPLRMTGVTMDITDRRAAELLMRQSEERFRLAADAVAALIYDWDPKTNTVLRTAGLTKILGYDPDEVDRNEQWWRDQIHPDDLPDAQRRYERAFANGERGFSQEYRVRHRDGRWVHVWDRCSLMRENDDNTVSRIIGSIVDVTDLKRAQIEMQAAKEIAESADRAKDQFLAMLSHELRTPLAPVLGAVQLWAHDQTVPAQAREDLEMIRRNIELEARLIDDLLDLTRIARGKIDLQLHPCDAHLAINRAVEMCQPDMVSKDLRLTIDLSAPRSVVVADAARVQQIVWNLVQNAVKFTPAGGQITVQSVVEDEHLIVRVIDDGIGIAAGSLDRIFDAFEQISRDVTRRFGGLGLGLAISKKLVDLHGGQIIADSKGEGHGSTFTLRFPLAPVDQTVIEPIEPEVAAPTEQVSLTENDGLRILLVEDHRDTAEVIARLLRSNHYQVQTAGNVAEALDLASRETFDLVISDLGLPDGSGHELMQQLLDRARAADLARPIKGIALTGFGMDSDLDQSKAAGFVEHLTKPIDLQSLEASIQRVVQAQQ